MNRRTKIVATLGPATDGITATTSLLESGVDVVRLNLSHGTMEGHRTRLADVRASAAALGRPVAVVADLPGPKIRAGSFPDGGVILATGSTVRLVPGSSRSDSAVISVDYPLLLEELQPSDGVIIGDGAIALTVIEVGDGSTLARVQTGGRVQGRPGVHLACERLSLQAPTAMDEELAAAIVAEGVEYVALSFVRRASDIDKLRAVIGHRAGIVAKIETASAFGELRHIVEHADAVMVARGDLGIDCPIEDVPHLQKQIIRMCVAVGTPVITATQMLESMIHSLSPTRAEVSDVANSIFDGTDAVMLSGETAIGQHPAVVVATMSRIAARAEVEASYRQWANLLGRVQRESWADDTDRVTASITHAAAQAALDVGASAIICCTRGGRTARAMARFRPEARLIAASPVTSTVNALSLSWGVEPIPIDEYTSTDELVWHTVAAAVARGMVDHGATVLVLVGAPDVATGATDVLRIVKVD